MSQAALLGIDVGSKELVCALQRDLNNLLHATFANTPEGHGKLLRWAYRHGGQLRACLEATGVYGLDLELALHRPPSVQVMVANPRAIKDFARANMVRVKTDKVDAQVILAYLERMPFKAWQPPSWARLELRAMARRIVQIKSEQTRERSRLHSATYGAGQAPGVVNDIGVNIRHLERRIEALEANALKLIQTDAQLTTYYSNLLSVRGIATGSRRSACWASCWCCRKRSRRRNGSPMPGWIPVLTIRALRFISRVPFPRRATATCARRCICPPWWRFSVSLR